MPWNRFAPTTAEGTRWHKRRIERERDIRYRLRKIPLKNLAFNRIGEGTVGMAGTTLVSDDVLEAASSVNAAFPSTPRYRKVIHMYPFLHVEALTL